jgi:hypothetical protein
MSDTTQHETSVPDTEEAEAAKATAPEAEEAPAAPATTEKSGDVPNGNMSWE